MAPLLIASDIDGTLLRSDGTVSDRTRAAVAAVEGAGLGFVLVTGRPPRWLAPVRDQLDHRGTAICANGALVMDLHSEEVLHVDAFDPAVGLEVIDRLRGLRGDLGFGVEWPDGFGHMAGYPRGIRRSELAPGAVLDITEDEALFQRPVIKILVRAADGPVRPLAEEAIAALGDLAVVTWSGIGLLEISAAGVTKASALERFAARRGAGAAATVAFGDQPNDLAMLRWVGRGIAVANAHPTVREAADEVTAANDEDGVAVVLERILERPAVAG